MRKGSPQKCAIAIINLGGLEKILSQNLSVAETYARELASAISVSLDPICTVGQYDRSNIIVFFPNVNSRENLKNQIKSSFSFTRLALQDITDMDSIRFIAGVVCVDSNIADWNSMIEEALDLCQLWQNSSADIVAFSQETNDLNWTKLRENKNDGDIEIIKDKTKHALSEVEKDIIFKCISAMLSSDSLDTSINSVLNYIGQYCLADRAYLISLSENRHVITMPYEWTDSHKTSIQQSVSGLYVDRFPALKQCMEQRLPVNLKRKLPFKKSAGNDDINYWHFWAFPLIEEDIVTGFLCLENPKIIMNEQFCLTHLYLIL